MPLNPMRAFAVASRHRTFTAAAQELGVTQVAISRQIALLEDYLGVPLFDRDGRSAKLTDIGRAYGQEIAMHFEGLETATARLLNIETANTIQLRIYPSVAHYWLLPRLSRFTDQYPGLRVRMDTQVAPLDFRGTQLDVAIQLGTSPLRDARSRKLFDERVDVVCAPAYATRMGPFVEPQAVAGGDLLHSHYRRRAWDDWARACDVALDQASGIEFDSSLLTYSAAAQGFGLAIGQVDLLAGELAAGRLVAPLNQPVLTGQAFHVVWPTTLSVSTKTRRFIDWLLKEAGEMPEFFKRGA
ncbi:LysR substrate-binding domain-containing protein [Sulfitobacter sp. PR48]|uniref:LysR substrate-binding domain-containing protein n=1 Tax=Sulfitobacter sp. PR48 TaxID=3028383 RepID=UPI00237C3C80|nr:LysR substrate-binding domain-containing protein [Sulfitobacter sp. PR48]